MALPGALGRCLALLGRSLAHCADSHVAAASPSHTKGWNEYGAFSNFSPHPITMPDGVFGSEASCPCDVRDPDCVRTAWPSVEHFYQAQKFAGVDSDEARDLRARILAADAPEQAAGLARRAERERPHLRRGDWSTSKVGVMRAALLAKFTQHEGPRELLMSTARPRPAAIVEASPHDAYWGGGRDGKGSNHLGRLLMELRADLSRKGVSSSSSGVATG